jgi:hypothetical protein
LAFEDHIRFNALSKRRISCTNYPRGPPNADKYFAGLISTGSIQAFWPEGQKP